MTAAEIFALYGAPWVLVVGAALIAWRNHVVMRRAHAHDKAQTALGKDTENKGGRRLDAAE